MRIHESENLARVELIDGEGNTRHWCVFLVHFTICLLSCIIGPRKFGAAVELHLEKLTRLERGLLCARCFDFQKLQHLTNWVHAIQKKEILSDSSLPREYRTALARCLQNDLFTQVSFRFLAPGFHCSRAAYLNNSASVSSFKPRPKKLSATQF
jgi:hypothetical protein